MKRNYHRFGLGERVGLFVRYQAYAALLFTLALAPLGLVAWLAPTRWWAWLIAVPIALRLGSFAVYVASRWRGKMRITAVAQRRIDAGRFSPDMVRSMCGDPCFRAVSAEILRRSGMPRDERAKLISRYKSEADMASSQTLIIDHQRGTVLRVEGDSVTTLASPNVPQHGVSS